MSVLRQHHDALLRALLDHPARAGALLRDHLPPEVAELLSPEPPHPVDGTFIDEELKETLSDRLFTVTPADGRPAFLYALLKHKSTPDPGTPLQLLGYMVAIWKQHLVRTGASPTRLLPIIPVVFYHRARAWTVPSSVPDCIDADDRIRTCLDRFQYTLRDLGPIPNEALSRERAVRAVLVRRSMPSWPGSRGVSWSPCCATCPTTTRTRSRCCAILSGCTIPPPTR